ncbi:hypothetical protein AB0L82_06745 [Nocardia sp. NPDC052001]|uniref:hypothetical protein n=1 Tax=Nocardia sp. NPDC052001 TaxID=3154853 RepID=UPI00343D72EF
MISTCACPRPPRWKQAVASGLAIFPISLLGNAVLGPLLAGAPLVLRTLVFTVLFSVLMTFAALPAVSGLLRGWLAPHPHPANEVLHHDH